MLSCWNLLKPVLGSARPGIRPMVEFYQKFSARNARQNLNLGRKCDGTVDAALVVGSKIRGEVH